MYKDICVNIYVIMWVLKIFSYNKSFACKNWVREKTSIWQSADTRKDGLVAIIFSLSLELWHLHLFIYILCMWGDGITKAFTNVSSFIVFSSACTILRPETKKRCHGGLEELQGIKVLFEIGHMMYLALWAQEYRSFWGGVDSWNFCPCSVLCVC